MQEEGKYGGSEEKAEAEMPDSFPVPEDYKKWICMIPLIFGSVQMVTIQLQVFLWLRNISKYLGLLSKRDTKCP